MAESSLDVINDNVDYYIPLIPTSLGDRRSIERDIIGSMLINGSIKTRYTLYTEDFKHIRIRGLYRHLINLSDEHGSFNQNEVLTDNIETNKYILNMMNEAVITNINLKIRRLLHR